MNNVTKNILCVIKLSKELLLIADRGDLQRKDDSCGVLYGIVRDCAYKIINAAEKEQTRHIQKGIWDSSDKN